ncbi:MAG: CRISPR-associated endonuclease Cas1 [Anaerolineae bacterium]|nr:CRISPR-associated endonuclease Cas1 [Anaerolineae bacterium]MCB0206656.1 CRISPR-associated endonuclease Cas1 [Anaerolineae bacterium]MCB0256075.1 CRISPR-associated endonuclease Cas1 [Anaerolineae bacterium]
MYPVYVVQQGSRLSISGGRLQVESDGNILLKAPMGQVSQVVIFGNSGLTTPAIGTLLKEGKDVVFLTEGGRYKGQLIGELTAHVPVRRAQYRRMDDPIFSLALAQGIVAAKLAHQRTLLQRHNRDLHNAEIVAAIDRLGEAVRTVERRTAVASLLGHEGAATAAYFSGFRRLFGAEWKFEKRERRPPPDPVNVLLSLGYTLLSNTARGAVQTAGLDPYAGFLHEYAYNRPSMALDLVEEFRPVVDGIVLWACRGGQVTPDDFTPGPVDRPVVLSEQGLRRFLKAYEQRMDQTYTHPIRQVKLPLRQCMIEQARQIAGRVRSGQGGYQGMGFR